MGKTSTSDKPWQVRKEHSDHMAMRQEQNKARNIPAEKWMAAYLERHGPPWLKWSRQARWGFRLFDFWCHAIGVAIEVDGPEHDADHDAERDRLDYYRSGIVVLRVRNFNEADARDAIAQANINNSWNDRRALLHKDSIRHAL